MRVSRGVAGRRLRRYGAAYGAGGGARYVGAYGRGGRPVAHGAGRSGQPNAGMPNRAATGPPDSFAVVPVTP